MRLTASRRDLLSLLLRDDMKIVQESDRFYTYELLGQLHRKMSRRNLQAFTKSRLVEFKIKNGFNWVSITAYGKAVLQHSLEIEYHAKS